MPPSSDQAADVTAKIAARLSALGVEVQLPQLHFYAQLRLACSAGEYVISYYGGHYTERKAQLGTMAAAGSIGWLTIPRLSIQLPVQHADQRSQWVAVGDDLLWTVCVVSRSKLSGVKPGLVQS